MLRFRAGRVWLGWPTDSVQEVVQHGNVTPLPRAPGHLTGLVSLDGRLVTVLDLVPLLELPSDAAPPARLVVIDLGGELAGIPAREVSGVVTPAAAEDTSGLRGNPRLLAACSTVGRAGGELVWCLDPARVLRLAREPR